jgi:hypothetical protein
MQVAEL